MVDHDVLEAHLTRLQLTAIRDQFDSLLDEAAVKGMTLREAVAFLVEREVARRDERRIEMAFKIAHFPAVRERASTSGRCANWRRRGGWSAATRRCCSARPESARRTSPWRSAARRSGSATRCCSPPP